MRSIQFIIITALLSFSQQNWAVTLKIATLSPDGSYWMQQMRGAGAEITQKTEGRVKFKFYPGGVMGNDQTVLRKMRLRQLHGAALTNAALSGIYPDIQLYNLVLKFRNLAEVDFVRSKMDQMLIDGLENKGYVAMGFAEVGMAYVMSTEPIQDLDQMRRYKTWVPNNNKVALAAMEAFSISPVPLPLRDVLMGLQTGMIEVVAGSPIGALALQWHTKVKYVSDIPLLYVYGALVFDNKAMRKISPEDQTIIRQVMTKASQNVDKRSREDNINAAAAMKQLGIKFLEPTAAAAEELRTTIVSANEKIEREGNLSADKVNRLNALLTEYRSQAEK